MPVTAANVRHTPTEYRTGKAERHADGSMSLDETQTGMHTLIDLIRKVAP